MKRNCDDEKLAQKLAEILPYLNERQQRLLLAAEARSLGYGGVSQVARAYGVSRPTIHRGLKELDDCDRVVTGIRHPGGGRKRVEQKHPAILAALEQLVEPDPGSDPMSPLRWTCKSTRQLAAALKQQGYRVSHQAVADLLHAAGYSLQKNAKVRHKTAYPDRNEQFYYLNKQIETFLQQGLPVISVDTKKKELIRFENPTQLDRTIPHSNYDLGHNTGWVSVKPDRNTTNFAVDSLLKWWRSVGRFAYPTAKQLLIGTDAGSNKSQVRLWQLELRQFVNTTGLEVTVCYLPLGTSKWNKIEHRLFCQIAMNWRERPLVSHEAIVELIGSTTSIDLQVQAELDIDIYPTQVRDIPHTLNLSSSDLLKMPDAQMATVRITPHQFYGEWNYTIAPNWDTNI